MQTDTKYSQVGWVGSEIPRHHKIKELCIQAHHYDECGFPFKAIDPITGREEMFLCTLHFKHMARKQYWHSSTNGGKIYAIWLAEAVDRREAPDAN